MLLKRLCKLHERIQEELIPSYHKTQKCRWILEISEDGSFLKFIETGQTKRSARSFIAPYRRRSGRTPPPYLLVDKPAYVLGLPRNQTEKWKKKAAHRHDRYTALVETCAEAVDHPALEAICTFLERHRQEALAAPATEEMQKGDLIIPRVDGTLPTQIPEVQQFWIERQDAEAAEKSALTTECTVCGEIRPAIRTEPIELTLGPDTVSVITGNEPAFLSHGLEQSEIAPVCQPCARKYGEALRYLLENDQHHRRLANLTWIYWTGPEPDAQCPVGDPNREGETLMRVLMEAPPDEVQSLLEFTEESTSPSPPFYAAALTSNISRLAVRRWISAPLAEIRRNATRFFERMRLVGRGGPRYHGIYALAGSLVRDLNDLTPRTIEPIVTHALTGRPLPRTLLQQAMRRAHADSGPPITHPRAALLKLVLLSNQPDSTTPMAQDRLVPTHQSTAYQCGRLLAVLESAQREALGTLETTVASRYYHLVSTAPASMFETLLHKADDHLNELQTFTRGLGSYFQEQIETITTRIEEFPRALNVQDQALFALGYYQQRNRTGNEPHENGVSESATPPA